MDGVNRRPPPKPFVFGLRDVIFIAFLVANVFAVFSILWLHDAINNEDSPANLRTKAAIDRLESDHPPAPQS